MFDFDFSVMADDKRVRLSAQTDQPLLALRGPSGAGKTTLCHAIAGLLSPDQGHIRIAGRTLFDASQGINLQPEDRGVGYAFQDDRLFPHLTVQQNCEYAQRYRAAMADALAFRDIADALGIAQLLHRKPIGLSGGEAKRVSIARAIMAASRALILDEPLAGQDQDHADRLLAKITSLCVHRATPLIYISHQPNAMIDGAMVDVLIA